MQRTAAMVPLTEKLITLVSLVGLVVAGFYSFRWRALARPTWWAFWGWLGLAFAVSLLRGRDQPLAFWPLLTLAAMAAKFWAVVLLPPLLVAAWVWRRIRAGRGADTGRPPDDGMG